MDLAVGETLEVCLPENRTTGFKWILESSVERACSLVSDHVEPGHLAGQPGKRCWHFRAEHAGSEHIRMSYQRPWEEKKAPARTFTLGIRVRE
jgi:inhibitor of cysteine peptidase